jgi:hypothetical protein
VLRLDQAPQAERHGELHVWGGWRAHTWRCWAAPAGGRRSAAVEAVRSTVRETWG